MRKIVTWALAASLLCSSVGAVAVSAEDEQEAFYIVAETEDTEEEAAFIVVDVDESEADSDTFFYIADETPDSEEIIPPEVEYEPAPAVVLDNIPPVIQSFSMDKTVVFPGDTITFTAVITDESGINGKAHLGFSTPTHSTTDVSVYLSPQSDGKTYKGTYTVPAGSVAGSYKLNWLSAEDIYGNHKQISLSNTFTVKDGKPDNAGPSITNFRMDKSVASPGDTITFTATVSDPSGVSGSVHLGISAPTYSITTDSVYLTKQADGTYKGAFYVKSNAVNGTYTLNWITADDTLGNHAHVSLSGSFRITGGVTDSTGPTITEFRMDKSIVYSGESITFTARITDPSGVKGSAHLGISAPTYSITTDSVYLTKQADGLYRGTFTPKANTVAGRYTLNWITADDIYDNHTHVSLSSSFTVSAEVRDTEGPVIGPVNLNQKEVTAGESVTFSAEISDPSGISGTPMIKLTVPGETTTYQSIPLYLAQGNTYEGSFTVDEETPDGLFHVIEISAMDRKGNNTRIVLDDCFYVYSDGNQHMEITEPGAPATCTEDGLTDGSHCEICGDILVPQEIIPALGHTEITDEGTAPSCTEDGLSDGSHCEICGDILVPQETIPALGHTDEDQDHVCDRCDTILPFEDQEYEIVVGKHDIWIIGSNVTLHFRSLGDFKKFIKLLINGKEIPDRYYTVTEGSTIIDLSPEYLNTLPEGKHTMTMIFTDGKSSTDFEVQAASPKDPDPTNPSQNDPQNGPQSNPQSNPPSNQKPAATAPQTGDPLSPAKWMSLLLLSGVYILIYLARQKKYNCK